MSHQPPYSKAIVEALSPREIARQVEEAGVAKARAGVVSTLALAMMAGAFIGLGGVLAATIGVGSELGAGPTRLLMDLGLTMALFMVVVTGSELFTGNNMMLMGLFTRRISILALGRNWALVYVGNLAGALIVVLLVYYGRWWEQGDFSFGGAAMATAAAKVNLSFETAFVRGVLANILVCMVSFPVGGRCSPAPIPPVHPPRVPESPARRRPAAASLPAPTITPHRPA